MTCASSSETRSDVQVLDLFSGIGGFHTFNYISDNG
jgi:hypothetical protein